MIRIGVLLLLAALPCEAATLRPYGALSGPVVRLSDLFDDVGQDRPLGPAPAPGGRIVVESSQLAAIARQFGVEWRPSSPGDRVVLERPGRPLSRADVIEPLRAALRIAGAVGDSDLELSMTSGPLVPSQGPLLVDANQVELDQGTGRFSGLLDVTAEGSAPQQLRVSGRMIEMVTVPTVRRRMQAGEVVSVADLDWTRLRTGQARGDILRDPKQIAGLMARHTLQPGQAIQTADIGRPTIVEKGAPILMTFDNPGIQLTAQGIAMEAAGLGDLVHVINPTTRVVVEAEMTAPGRARVIPGSKPLPVSNRLMVAR